MLQIFWVIFHLNEDKAVCELYLWKLCPSFSTPSGEYVYLSSPGSLKASVLNAETPRHCAPRLLSGRTRDKRLLVYFLLSLVHSSQSSDADRHGVPISECLLHYVHVYEHIYSPSAKLAHLPSTRAG